MRPEVTAELGNGMFTTARVTLRLERKQYLSRAMDSEVGRFSFLSELKGRLEADNPFFMSIRPGERSDTWDVTWTLGLSGPRVGRAHVVEQVEAEADAISAAWGSLADEVEARLAKVAPYLPGSAGA